MQLLPVRSNLQVNGTNTSLIHSSINCGHVTISAQHFLMIILSPTLCVIITPALLVMYSTSGEMTEIIYSLTSPTLVTWIIHILSNEGD